MPNQPDNKPKSTALRAEPKQTLLPSPKGNGGASLQRHSRARPRLFVRVIDYMGNDEAICQAAPRQYGPCTKSSNDEGLIRYLMRHWALTPFEMCEIKLHVKLPVLVARQWIRHRTANATNTPPAIRFLDREFYIPNPPQC